MSKFCKIAVFVIILELILILFANAFVYKNIASSSGRMYRVEASRIASKIKAGESYDIDDYKTIISVHEYDSKAIVNNDYVIIEVNGTLYQFEYETPGNYNSMVYMNIGFGIMLVMSAIIFIYVNNKILKPFNNMSEVSVELAKGNLSAHVKEDKNKFFGKFLWGIDMLRENLENNKEKELQLQKEKKTLILSISHDIKTPLSAIKLYTKALKNGLYDTKEKQDEALIGIEKNTQDIEKYVSEIVAASKEDFLNLAVNNGEFYLSDVIDKINVYYSEKFASLHTEFVVNNYDNCLLKGDQERLIEVIQNMLENAIKYGDGRRVEIAFDDEEDCKLISVNNSGNSLKKEELPHLFESFYRGSNSENIKGSGLGLYICKSLLRMMDGDIFANISDDIFSIVAVVRKV